MASTDDASAAGARASIKSLPLELIHHIIRLSVSPSITKGNIRGRYIILRRLALVNSSWFRLAQTELNRHVYLGSKTYDILIDALSAPSKQKEESRRSGLQPRESWKTALVRRADTLWLKAREMPWPVDQLQRLLEYLPNVSELRVGHAMSDPYVSDYLGSSAFALSLRILHLTTTLLTPSSFSPAADVFPNLTELVLECPCSLVKAMDFLEYTSFPSLRTLALLSWKYLDPRQDGPRLDSALRHFAPNLHCFAFDCNEYFIQRPRDSNPFQLDLTDFTSLRHLSIPLVPDDVNLCTLERLPSQLSTLRLLDSFLCGDDEALVLARNEWPKCLATVKKITLPEWAGAPSTRDEYSRHCTPKGIVFEYRDTTDFD